MSNGHLQDALMAIPAITERATPTLSSSEKTVSGKTVRNQKLSFMFLAVHSQVGTLSPIALTIHFHDFLFKSHSFFRKILRCQCDSVQTLYAPSRRRTPGEPHSFKRREKCYILHERNII